MDPVAQAGIIVHNSTGLEAAWRLPAPRSEKTDLSTQSSKFRLLFIHFCSQSAKPLISCPIADWNPSEASLVTY
jgi:hypothetical protein